jgi:hypothetical protein
MAKKTAKKTPVATFTGNQLKKRYDRYFRAVLRGRIKEVEQEGEYRRIRKGSEKWKAVKPLPTDEEYEALRDKEFRQTVEDLVNEANGEVDSLKDELQDWYDNLPQGFQDGEKGQNLQEAIDALESISQPDFPDKADVKVVVDEGTDDEDEVSILTVLYFPSEHINSRADRAAEAAGQYRMCAEAIREYFEEQEEKDSNFKRDSDLSSFADECEAAADELEAVCFPGMYG